MHNLSVHDMVWINNIVTGKTLPFDYEKLEAAMAAQYSYGESDDLLTQAGFLLASLLLRPPFAYGNRRTAFLATVTFLNANGRRLKVDDTLAADILQRAARKEITPQEAIVQLSEPAENRLRPGVTLRQLVSHLCNEHTDALRRLAEGDE